MAFNYLARCCSALFIFCLFSIEECKLEFSHSLCVAVHLQQASCHRRMDPRFRLFNLAADVDFAGLRESGKTLADEIQYSLGSEWVPVPTASLTLSAVSDPGGHVLASTSYMAPTAPEVFT
eukprot:SAG11_NODE_1797_length_4246_cov_2.922354_5_plen_121_part_00